MTVFVAATPVDYATWGNLVLSWSTGTNFTKAAETPTLPGTTQQVTLQTSSSATVALDMTVATMAEFNAAATGAATVTFPATVQTIVFVKDSATVRFVRLPDPAMATAARSQLQQGIGHYSLPTFYLVAPLNCNNPGNITDAAERLKLQAERVGDYSIGSCM